MKHLNTTMPIQAVQEGFTFHTKIQHWKINNFLGQTERTSVAILPIGQKLIMQGNYNLSKMHAFHRHLYRLCEQNIATKALQIVW